VQREGEKEGGGGGSEGRHPPIAPVCRFLLICSAFLVCLKKGGKREEGDGPGAKIVVQSRMSKANKIFRHLEERRKKERRKKGKKEEVARFWI